MKKYINKVNILLVVLMLISGTLLILNSILDFQIPIEYNTGIGSETTRRLQQNDKIEITTTSRVSNLEALQLEIVLPESNPEIKDSLKEGDVVVSIYDEEENLIYYNDLLEIQIFDSHELYFKFDKIKDSVNKKYKIVIETSKNLNHKLFKLKKTPEDNELDSAIMNGKELKEDLSVIQYGTDATSFYRVLLITIIFILFAIFCRYNFKNNEKLKKFLLKKKKVFIIEFIASLIACFSYLVMTYKSHYMGNFDILTYGVFAFATLIIFAILGIFLGDKKLKREDLFLLIGIPLSTMFLVFILPLNVPDELSHYRTATKVSMLQVFNQDIMIPKGLEEMNLYTLFNNNISYNTLEAARSGGYHPILYIFSGFGILLSKLLQLDPMIGIYMGRCANLIVFFILGYYTIKKIPMEKFLMIIYLLNPMFLQQAASLSVDALTNICSMLFIAYVLYIKYDKKKIETKDFLVLLISFMCVLVGKYAYFLLGLLFIIIWKELKEYIKTHKKIALIITLIIVAIASSWFIYTRFFSTEVTETLTYQRPQSEESKLMHILRNPMNVIPIYINNFLVNANAYVITFFGQQLGALNIGITQIYILTYIVILILSIFIDKEKYEMDKKNKIINIIIFVLTFHIVLAGLYLGWGVTTDVIIQGVQGRYFIPIVILVLLLANRKRNWNLKNIEVPILIILLATNILIMRDVLNYFIM